VECSRSKFKKIYEQEFFCEKIAGENHSIEKK